MAHWDRTLIGSNPTVMLRVELWEGTVEHANNRSWIHYKLSFLTSNGSRTGTWDYWMNVNGGRVATASFGGSHSGWQTVVNSGYWHGRDANGYGSASAEGWGDVYYGSGSTGGSIGLARIGRAPQGIEKSADQITPTSARLGRKQDNHGNGTSSANRSYYRLDNTGGWSETAEQGGTGWKYNTVTLLPNRMYGYFSRHWNNNGDTADTGVSTFVTLANVTSVDTVTVLATTATFSGVVVSQGYRTTNTKIQYRVKGTTPWTDTPTQTGTGLTFVLNGLLPNTVYERRFVTTTTDGTFENGIFEFTTLPAGKLVMPNGDVKNAITRLVRPNGSVEMVNINLVD